MLLDGLARRAFNLAGDAASTAPPEAEPPRQRLKIGLALGGGAARGWAHVGVLRVLDEVGIRPDVIAGCSIGAVVGGCYAAGKLDQLEGFARTLTKRRVMGLLDFHIGGSGLIGGTRLRKLLELDLGETRIEALPIRFATVATELMTGHEIWLTKGGLVEALRASYALPGVFDPVRLGGRWLMDGALVNPVPVTLARAFGADVVICVNLNNDVRLRGTVIQGPAEDDPTAVEPDEEPRTRGFFPNLLDGGIRFGPAGSPAPPAWRRSWWTPSTSPRIASRVPGSRATRRTPWCRRSSVRSACSSFTGPGRRSSSAARRPSARCPTSASCSVPHPTSRDAGRSRAPVRPWRCSRAEPGAPPRSPRGDA